MPPLYEVFIDEPIDSQTWVLFLSVLAGFGESCLSFLYCLKMIKKDRTLWVFPLISVFMLTTSCDNVFTVTSKSKPPRPRALAQALLAQEPVISPFLVQPIPDTPPEPTRKVFLVFGDAGTGSREQYKVGDAMYRVCQTRGCDFALMLGDNIYENGVKTVSDPQFQTKFEQPYSAFGRFDFWAAPGNHDWHQDVSAQVNYTAKSERWRMPSYHFKVPETPSWLHIYSLDTSSISDPQVTSVRTAMCNEKGWKILFGHHPIHSNGSHGDEPSMNKKVKPMMKQCGIQIYLAGHDHHQEHITGQGFEQFIQGAAAKLRKVAKVPYHTGDKKRQNFAVSRLGFSVIEMTPDQIVVDFYDLDSKPLYHWEQTIAQVGLL
ncbi:MAG: metallophosphoesterase [Bdellovibrionales bacterium]|nr:metallophosphoesterase [Bdellovibrionales bacterium]